MKERNAVSLLAEWGKWSYGGGLVDLGCGGAMLDVMQLAESSLRFSASITDDDALRVDRVVGQLKMQSERLYKIIFWAFVLNCSIREIAEKLAVSRDSVAKDFEYACGWIEGGLNFCEAA